MSTPSTTRRPPNFLTSSVALSARSCDRKRLHCRSPARMNSGAERVRESENRTHRELVAVNRVPRQPVRIALEERKSVVWGKSVSARVDIGGGRIIKKKQQRKNTT